MYIFIGILNILCGILVCFVIGTFRQQSIEYLYILIILCEWYLRHSKGH